MKDSTKQNLDDMTDDLVRLRKNNGPTYWGALILAGIALTGLITLIFKHTGIILLVTAAFCYMMNNLLNAWLEIRKTEKENEEYTRKLEAKQAKRTFVPVVVEKDKTIRINPK